MLTSCRSLVVAIVDNSFNHVLLSREILCPLVSRSFALRRRFSFFFRSYRFPLQKLITPLELTTSDTDGEATTMCLVYRYYTVAQTRKHTRIEGRTRVRREKERGRDRERERDLSIIINVIPLYVRVIVNRRIPRIYTRLARSFASSRAITHRNNLEFLISNYYQ